MKRFLYPVAALVFITTAAFADTLPEQVRAEAQSLLVEIDRAKAQANSRSSLAPAALPPQLVGGLQRFGMSASRLSTEIDKTGGPTDLRCIFRGMAEETDNQLKAVSAAKTGAEQAAALTRLAHMLRDAVEIAPAVGGKAMAGAAKPPSIGTCPAAG
jgi:hypothetical protein